MAAKGLESFLAQVEQEPSLQEQLSKLDLQGVLNLAKEQGFEVRAADLLRAQAEQILAMSDDELDLLDELHGAVVDPCLAHGLLLHETVVDLSHRGERVGVQ